MAKTIIPIAIIFCFLIVPFGGMAQVTLPPQGSVFVSAPIDQDSPAKGGNSAQMSVFRIVCMAQNSAGTGFLHKSKKIITAAHVVTGCANPIIITSDNKMVNGKVDNIDPTVDLALIESEVDINAPPLALYSLSESDIKIGRQVSTWGFPGGYSGLSPMLSVGYLSGVQANTTPGGQLRRQ
jgi:S1-C subfamily serine protease